MAYSGKTGIFKLNLNRVGSGCLDNIIRIDLVADL